MKWIKNIALTLLIIFATYGLWNVFNYFQRMGEPNTEVSGDVILERVENVMKLIAVEGHFAEIYNYKDYVGYDIWPLRKSALIRVNAKVSVGYDLENISIEKDEDTKTITISEFPHAEILSIDHDLEYYDMQNGLFNVISNKDVTDMSAQAKTFIKEKAEKSELFEKVQEQKLELLKMMQYLAGSSEWKVVVNESQLKN